VSDWKRHKPDCPPVIVKEVPGKGRGLFATRGLPLGFTLLTEQPVLTVDTKKPDHDKLLTDFQSKNKETRMEILKFNDHPNNDADDQDQDVLSKLVRIFRVNSMVKRLDGKEVSINLYLKASLLNHSCSPNVVLWDTRSRVETILKGKLLRKVVKGEELTISYYNSHPADDGCLTKEQRKEKLLVKYGFECLCDICKEENIEDENLRKEFQEMKTHQQLIDEMLKIASQAMGIEKFQQQFEELLVIAKRKVEIAKVVDSNAVFDYLTTCWSLSQYIAAVKKDQEAREQAAQYKEEVDVWAKIMGPEAVEFKMDLEEKYKRLFGDTEDEDEATTDEEDAEADVDMEQDEKKTPSKEEKKTPSKEDKKKTPSKEEKKTPSKEEKTKTPAKDENIPAAKEDSGSKKRKASADANPPKSAEKKKESPAK